MAITLPPPLAGYFAADRTGDTDAVLSNFAEDAVVVDEGRTHTGHDQIRRWKTEAAARYSYTAEPVAIAQADGQTIVTAHLTGDFPGSPIDLRYRFALHGDRIVALEIAP